MDKVITTINNVLIENEVLAEKLALTSWDKPAIFDNWGEKDVKFNYIIASYQFYSGNHYAKSDSIFNADIFTKGPSTIEAEDIKNIIINLLDRQIFESDESGPIRLYLNSDMIIPEDTHDVVHWNVEFRIVFWRKSFIMQLIS